LTGLPDEYSWAADNFPGMEEPNHVIEAASFGIGALPNCMFPLLNVLDSEVMRDNSAIRPGSDPGSGAFTVFHDRRGLARKAISAGEEIFVGEFKDTFFLVYIEEEYLSQSFFVVDLLPRICQHCRGIRLRL
jgi:hypothetical protein